MHLIPILLNVYVYQNISHYISHDHLCQRTAPGRAIPHKLVKQMKLGSMTSTAWRSELAKLISSSLLQNIKGRWSRSLTDWRSMSTSKIPTERPWVTGWYRVSLKLANSLEILFLVGAWRKIDLFVDVAFSLGLKTRMMDLMLKFMVSSWRISRARSNILGITTREKHRAVSKFFRNNNRQAPLRVLLSVENFLVHNWANWSFGLINRTIPPGWWLTYPSEKWWTTLQLGSSFPKCINHIYIYRNTKYGFKYLKNKTHVWNPPTNLIFCRSYSPVSVAGNPPTKGCLGKLSSLW